MDRWLAFGVGAGSGAVVGAMVLLGSTWQWPTSGACRVLEVDVALEGEAPADLEGAVLPAGTRFVVVGADEVHEVRVPVRLPAATPTRPCEHERPTGLSGYLW